MIPYRKITVGEIKKQLERIPDDAEFCTVGLSNAIPLLQFSGCVYGVRDNVLMVHYDVMEQSTPPPNRGAK